MAYVVGSDTKTTKQDVKQDIELISTATKDEESNDSLTYSKIKSKSFAQIFIFALLVYIPFIAGGIFMPLYGAQWFGGCLVNNLNIIDPDCTPNYAKYAFFSTLFQSIGGLMSFTFSAFVGRLTDAFGRKYFYILGVLGWMVPRTLMCFYVNFYIYWTLTTLLADINVNELATKGGIADIIHKKHRINAFGKLHIAAGIGLFVGTLFAIIISSIWDNHSVFYALTVVYTIIILYVIIFMQETIDINHSRRSLNKAAFKNPLRPLLYAFRNKLMLILSVTCLSLALCESGVFSVLFAYIGTEMKLYNDAEASLVFGIYVIIISVSMMMVSGFGLPYLQKVMSDTMIIFLACVVKIIALVLMVLISFYPSMFVLMLSGIFFGSSWFCWPCLDGIISNNFSKSFQGTAFGVQLSYMQLAAIFGPFGFGYLYHTLHNMGIGGVFIVLAIVFCIIAMVLVLFPLQNELKKLNSTQNEEQKTEPTANESGNSAQTPEMTQVSLDSFVLSETDSYNVGGARNVHVPNVPYF